MSVCNASCLSLSVGGKWQGGGCGDLQEALLLTNSLSAAISAAYLSTRRCSVIRVALFLRSVGVTCVTVVEKRRKKRVKNIA